MNCPQCQTANAPDSAFCRNCGARLASPEASAPAGGSPSTGTGTPLGYSPSAPGTAAGAQPAGGYPQGQNQPPAGGQYVAGAARNVAPFSLDLNRLTTVDKIVGVASLIAMISIWLPWYSVSWGGDAFQRPGSESFSGTWGHGWLWLEFVVALALIAYLVMRAGWADSPVRLPVAHAPLLIVVTGVQLLLLLIAFADIPYGGDGMGWGWAAFIGLLAGLAAAGPVIVPAVRSYLESKNASGGYRQG